MANTLSYDKVSYISSPAIKRKLVLSKKWNGLLFWYAFFMTFPVVTIVQNISIYVFLIMIFFILRYVKRPLITLNNFTQWAALFFAIGAIVSVYNAPNNEIFNATNRGLAVLPNYLYWSIIIIIFVSQRELLDFQLIYKALLWGIIASIIYFLFFERVLTRTMIFNPLGDNSFSFLLICYSPVCIWLLHKKKGVKWSIGFLIILITIQLFEGRRAGTFLVFLSGLATIFINQVTWKKLMWGIFAIFIGIAFTSSPIFEKILFNSNKRIYELIYKTEEVKKTDRSYLFRIAMVKKGLTIYNNHKFSGIGLNNFKNFSVEVPDDFEGAQYVIYKKNFNKLSSHNSYINILAEGGLVLFIPFIVILAYNILFFFLNFPKVDDIYKPIYIGLIGMSIHLYFIAAIVNVYAWFLIAMVSSITSLITLKKSSPLKPRSY